MNKIFNRETLITNFIPFALLYLPMYFISTHFFGEWSFLLILYGFTLYGAMMLWDSYYKLQQASKSLGKTLNNLSDKEINNAVSIYTKLYPEHSEVVEAELAKFRKQAGRQ